LEALLDFTEHPPENVFIVLTTTEPSSLKPTIKRRCHQYEVKALTEKSLTNLLNKIAEKEQLVIDPSVMERIIQVADGSAGQALKILDQISGVSVPHALELITNIFGDTANGFQIAQILMKSGLEPAERWKKCSELLQVITGEPEANRRIIQGYFNSVLLKKPYDANTAEIVIKASNFTSNYYDSGKLGLALSIFHACE
jgi:DNA polymerase III gamma/tau subunit